MSGNADEDRTESGKTFPLDLAAKITTVRTVDGKTPLVMTGQALRNMRVLTPSSSGQATLSATNIITTDILTQAVKQEGSRSPSTNTTSQPQSSSIIQRPAQITLTASLPVLAHTPTATYHVPRGPAVVANLAAPRSNMAATIRSPMIVSAQVGNQSSQAFVRPSRTQVSTQGTAWLTTSSTSGSQVKGAQTVLSSPVRGASLSAVNTAGKPQIVNRMQGNQTVASVRPTATILHSAIIGQGAQIHPFKPGQATTAFTSNTLTLTQALPARTQNLVYSAPPRMAVTTGGLQNRQITTTKAVGQSNTARLSVPINVIPTTKLVTPQGAVLAAGKSLTMAPQTTTLLGSAMPARFISTTQANLAIGRTAITVTTPSQNVTSNVLGQSRISTLSLHPLVVANSSQARTVQAQGTKLITQAAQVNVQPVVAQRAVSSSPSQTVPISKVFPSQGAESSSVVAPGTNVFIQAPAVSAVTSRPPGPTNATSVTAAVTTTVATYSIASGTYFLDATGTYSVAHSFSQPSFAALPQSTTQQVKPAIATQVHGIVTNQQIRFNPVVVVEHNRSSSQYSTPQQQQQQQPQESSQEVAHPQMTQVLPTQAQKITSSPRPSILRKRDYEGSPLKASKNLTSSLSSVTITNQDNLPSISPPLRLDSGGNGNSSGGSTTVSATSSPGVAETNEDSMPPVSTLHKDEEEANRPPTEMSPRKKPRKQQFGIGSTDLDENMHDDMQFITDSSTIKKEEDSDDNRSCGKEETSESTTPVVRKPTTPSLLNSYRQTWKATHNHYLRYSDVRPKDERRPTIMDLANQCRILDKVNGWKIHHLSTQMEDLADEEQAVYDQLTKLLKFTEAEEKNSNEKEINHINELIKGNLQRIKIINDGMIDAKSQIMKIFDHKIHVTDIINRCASKRNFKKREKS